MPATRSSTRRRSGQAGLAPQNDSGIGPSAGNSEDPVTRGLLANLDTIMEISSHLVEPSPQRAPSHNPSSQRASSSRVNSSPYARPKPRGYRPAPLELGDLGVVCTLGTGSYGQVTAVRVIREAGFRGEATIMDRPGAFMAMKAFDKFRIRRRERKSKDKEFKSLERKILADLPWNPFVSGLIDVLVDEKNLYQLMELGVCGSLMGLIKRKQRLSERTAKFYFSNIILAIEFIQSHGIIHRDVKPENIFVNGDGYLMLGDFGCAAHWQDKGHWHRIGTQVYMSPECADPRHPLLDYMKPSFDYWAAGIVLYEMLNGAIYMNEEKGETYTGFRERIFRGEIDFPAEHKISVESQDFLKQLLNPVWYERLQGIVHMEPPGPKEAWDIRDHPYMADINWDDVEAGRKAAPWVPIPTPQPDQVYQSQGRPKTENLPGLQHITPAGYFERDNRLDVNVRRSVRNRLIP